MAPPDKPWSSQTVGSQVGIVSVWVHTESIAVMPLFSTVACLRLHTPWCVAPAVSLLAPGQFQAILPKPSQGWYRIGRVMVRRVVGMTGQVGKHSVWGGGMGWSGEWRRRKARRVAQPMGEGQRQGAQAGAQ